MKKSVLMVLSIIASSLALPLLASGPHGTQAGWPIDDSGNILITDAVADRMAQSGAGWIRRVRLHILPAAVRAGRCVQAGLKQVGRNCRGVLGGDA